MLRISGQVVRTHPVHPELSRGTFSCGTCNTLIRNVEQQFKYTQVKIVKRNFSRFDKNSDIFQPSQCTNPNCDERRNFTLDIRKSTFVDFQKLRVQEIQAELPRGSIPRRCFGLIFFKAIKLLILLDLSLEVILRGECVEMPQPGDRCDFVGTLIVIPDVAQLSVPGTLLLYWFDQKCEKDLKIF